MRPHFDTASPRWIPVIDLPDARCALGARRKLLLCASLSHGHDISRVGHDERDAEMPVQSREAVQEYPDKAVQRAARMRALGLAVAPQIPDETVIPTRILSVLAS